MSTTGSITRCLDKLKQGDRAAAEGLWDAYMRRLIGLARTRLGGTPRQASDEEDVALSAFDSFYRRAEAGGFARLSDRDDLWQILVLITERKAVDLMRREGRKSRGEGKVESLSRDDGRAAVDPPDDGPSPEFAAQFADEFRHRLEALGDASLRAVAIAKMEGYTNREIAERLGCIEQTVERKLRSIRRIWTEGERP
jgi:DNA-directed RNA polymerase specialized sigma24 family protein